MKKLSLLVVTAFLICTSVAFAEVRVGVMDLQYCLVNSDAGKKAQEELTALEHSLMSKLQPLREELAKMEQDYVEQEKVLTEAVKKTRIDAIQKKGAEYDAKYRAYYGELQNKNEDLMNKIMVDLEVIVKQIGDEGKYDIIMIQQSVLYGKNVKDLNADIIARYNKQNKEGK